MGMHFPPWSLFWRGIIISFGGNFHFGYQLSVTNPTKDVFHEFLNASYKAHYGNEMDDTVYRIIWSLILNMLLVGAGISLPLVPMLVDRLGRKPSLAIGCSILVLATFPSALSKYFNSFELLTVGRFFYGVGCGLTAGTQSIYLHEISSVENRGFLGAMNGLFVQVGFGVVLTLGLPNIWGGECCWPNLYWVELIPTILLLMLLPLYPESPKFLIQTEQPEKAWRSLHKLISDPVQVTRTLRDIQNELKMESKALSIPAALRRRYLRMPIFLGAFVAFMGQFCGIPIIDFFTTYFITEAGLSLETASYVNLIIGFSGVVAAIIGTPCLDYFGRRPLLIVSCLILIIMNILFLIVFRLQISIGPFTSGPYLFVAGACVFSLFFAIGPGSIQWFIAGELVPHNARSASTTLSLLVLYVSGFIAGVVFLPLEGLVKYWSFLLFILPLTAGVGVVWWYLPETKNKSIAEVMRAFNKEGTLRGKRLLSISCAQDLQDAVLILPNDALCIDSSTESEGEEEEEEDLQQQQQQQQQQQGERGPQGERVGPVGNGYENPLCQNETIDSVQQIV